MICGFAYHRRSRCPTSPRPLSSRRPFLPLSHGLHVFLLRTFLVHSSSQSVLLCSFTSFHCEHSTTVLGKQKKIKKRAYSLLAFVHLPFGPQVNHVINHGGRPSLPHGLIMASHGSEPFHLKAPRPPSWWGWASLLQERWHVPETSASRDSGLRSFGCRVG